MLFLKIGAHHCILEHIVKPTPQTQPQNKQFWIRIVFRSWKKKWILLNINPIQSVDIDQT